MVMSIYHYLMIKFPGEQPSLVVRVTAILLDYKEKYLDIYKVLGAKMSLEKLLFLAFYYQC